MHLRGLWCATAVILGTFGCGRSAHHPGPPSAPALYGQPTALPSTSIPRVRPDSPALDWTTAEFASLQTELSPATLFQSRGKTLSVFTGLARYGLGGPTFACYSSALGPTTVRAGMPMAAELMQERWVLVWFAGARGWAHWDSPWVVYLQHKPTAMSLDEHGLHFQFPQAAGYVALMPLYGYQKAAVAPAGKAPAPNPKDKSLRTWEWENRIPKEALQRVRYWASALLEFPIYCEDSFSVDRSQDTVTIRQKMYWRSIQDDWHTRPLKVAPLSPPLALASLEPGFPVTFSHKVYDFELFTPYGPYRGVEGTDTVDATFKLLSYINQTEEPQPPNLEAHPTVRQAWDKLQATARAKFPAPDHYLYDHGGLNNFCWAILGDQWYAKALPWLEPDLRSVALASLRKYFHDDVLVTNRFKLREYPRGSGRSYYILEGPGIGSWGVLGDAGKFSANLLETLWAYAHFTGDWELIQARWDLIKKLFVTPAETRWVSFGRDAIAEMGDEAAPCLAMARMAYKVGDLDTYNYACYQFARELVHHYLKQRGASYYRRHQPWHSPETMDEEVYLTNLWGDLAAWQIDGPQYPARTGERQYANRWVRFKDADVGRFYREWLLPDVRSELDLLERRWDPKRKYHNDSHIMPSLVQLRALLLNESPEALSRVATPDQFTGPPSGVIASCLAVLRSSRSPQNIRLIPPGPASPFVAGLEREVSGPNPYLVQALHHEWTDSKTKARQLTWPQITWWGWKTPTGARWSFGHVQPGTTNPPTAATFLPLNWNAQAVTFTH